MAQTNINFRMDENLKNQFNELCGALGLNMTTAFTLFAKTSVRQQAIPVSLSLHEPNEITLAAMQEAEEMSKHPERYKSYSSVDDMIKDILSEDEEDA